MARSPYTPWSRLESQIDSRLAQSDIILLCISPSFFDSDYCYKAEMPEAMRRLHADSARIIPIILRPCAWSMLLLQVFKPSQRTDDQSQPGQTETKPVSTWRKCDAGGPRTSR